MNEDTSEKEFDQLDADVQEQLKLIAIARMRTVSHDTRISLGAEDYSSDELISHIEDDDELGKELIQMNWQYLKDLAAGALYDNE